MNKTELIAAIASKTELSKKDAEKALKAFTDVVTEELKKGEKIQLVGFGTFEVSERAARESKIGNYLMAKMALYVMWEIMIIYKFQKI